MRSGYSKVDIWLPWKYNSNFAWHEAGALYPGDLADPDQSVLNKELSLALSLSLSMRQSETYSIVLLDQQLAVNFQG